MPIIINLDVQKAKRKMRPTELSEAVGISSVLKARKVRAIRFSTLEELCRVPSCSPSNLLEYQE